LTKFLLPACKLLYPDNDFIFMQVGATGHTSNLYQATFKQHHGRRFIDKHQWPPKSPDLNPLDYYFWDNPRKLVYENRWELFANLAQLTRRIRPVWNQAIDMEHIQKSIAQFSQRARKVVEVEADPIKRFFG